MPPSSLIPSQAEVTFAPGPRSPLRSPPAPAASQGAGVILVLCPLGEATGSGWHWVVWEGSQLWDGERESRAAISWEA